MKQLTVIALRATAVTLLLAGILYPAVITAVAQVVFSSAANGGVVNDDRGRPVGSELIAQAFTRPGYFQPRPSAAGEKGFDATSSGGSKLGPTPKKLPDPAPPAIQPPQPQNPSPPP